MAIKIVSPVEKLVVNGTGGTLLDVQGSAGQLFSVTDSLTGDLFAVSDISGIPILNVNSSGAVDIDGTLAVDGKLGVGLTPTTVNLEVKSIQDSSFDEGIGIVRSNTSQTGYINMVGGAMNINAPNAVPIKFRDGGNTNLTIGGDGHATFAGNVALGGGALQSYHSNITSALALDDQASMFTRANQLFLGNNFYYGASDSGLAIETGKSSLIQVDRDKIRFYFAASASAGASSSLQEKFRIADDGTATFAGTIAASNLSGTNTGDQTLPTLSSLGALSTTGGTITSSSNYGLIINHSPNLGDFVDALVLRSTTSGQRAQLGFATVDGDGNHHRASIRAYKGSGNYEGVFGIAIRQTDASHTQRLTLTAGGNLSIDGTMSASNLSGSNTGDQTLPTLSSLGGAAASTAALKTFDSTANLASPSASNGTWTSATTTDWGKPRIGSSVARFNDGAGHLDFAVPTGIKTAYISQLTWDSGGYMDVYGVQTDGDEVFLRRINTENNVETTNHSNPNQHDGSTIAFAGHVGDFPTIRLHNKSGRFHLTGLGWSKSELGASDGTGLVHPNQLSTPLPYSSLSGKPTLGTAAATASTAYATAAQGTTADAALPKAAGSGNKLTDALYIQGTNTTNQESVLLRGISSNDGDWLGSIRTANTGGYNQEMRFYTSNANGTSDEDLTLTLHPTGNATFAGTIAASNLSGTNTGDQTLPTASSLGAVTLTGTQTISGNKTFSGSQNHYKGHLYYDSYDSAGNHYFHFNDGASVGGTTVNWRQYYGTQLKTHTWTSDSSGNMVFTFQGDIDANGGDITADNFSGSSSGTNTGDQTLSSLGGATAAQGTKADAALPKAGGTLTGDLTFSGTGKKIIYGNQISYNLPAQGTKQKILSLSTNTFVKVFMTSSENSFLQPIELHIYNRSDTEKPQIKKLNDWNWHTHSNDIHFSSDTSGNVYAEKISYSTGRVFRLKYVELIQGDCTLITAADTTTNDTGTDECIEGANARVAATSSAQFSFLGAGVVTTNSSGIIGVSTGYAPLASPALTGTPTAPTAGATVNTTQLATTAFVQTAVSNLVDSSPGALNTLNELAAALGDDASFSTTVTNSIATKLPLAGGTMTGDLQLGSFGNNNVEFVLGQTIANKTFNYGAEIQTQNSDIQLVLGRNNGTSIVGTGALGASASNAFHVYDTTSIAKLFEIAQTTGNATISGTIAASNLSGTNTGDQTLPTLSSLGGATAAQGTLATNALPKAGGTMTGDIILGDGIKASFGTGSDLNIYHNGTNGIIQNLTGGLYLLGSGGEVLSLFVKDGPSVLYFNNAVKFQTSATGVTVTGALAASTATFSIVDTLAVIIDEALIKNGKNIDVDSAAAETVITVAGISTYTAAFFDFVIKKGTNVRAGTVYSCHDGTNVEFTETSTVDLGDTSDVSLSVDISGTNMRLRATVTSDDWIVKSLVRAI